MDPPKDNVKDVPSDPSLEEEMGELRITEVFPFDHIPCTAPPEPGPEDLTGDGSSPTGAGHAYVVYEKQWADRQVLRVYFINPGVLERWKYGKKKITTDMIMEWASAWEKAPSAPQFAVTTAMDRADIRVEFSEKEGNWSFVGMPDAAKTKAPKPTMTLNLSGDYRDSDKKHLVIHEFGHALGLEHEHQRSDFWEVIKEFIDIDRMKDDRRFGSSKSAKKAFYGRNYEVKETLKGIGACKSEYDSKSIMHYWFDKDWIKDSKYHDVKAIISDPNLTRIQKKCLQGIHDRHNNLADEPSTNDFKILEEAYGGKLKKEEKKGST